MAGNRLWMTTGRWRRQSRMLDRIFSSVTSFNRPAWSKKFLRAAVELHPDFVGLGETFQALLHLGRSSPVNW